MIKIPVVRFFLNSKLYCVISDSTKVNDLENIQETDTPPQSPKMKDTVEVNLMSPPEYSTVQYKANNTDNVSPPEEGQGQEVVETPRRPSKQRKPPRRIIEYTEPEVDKGFKGRKQSPRVVYFKFKIF